MNFFTIFSPSTSGLNIEEIILNILLAFFLGLAVAMIYKLTGRQKTQSRTFLLTLIILSMVVALVMMVIGNSIARAFSLVGALSIIRFRTAIKDNRDIAFVFFALTVGMAAGIGNYPIAICGTGTIIVILLALDFIQFGAYPSNLYLLRFQLLPSESDSSGYLEVFKRKLSSSKQISVKTLKMGEFIEHTYMVRLKRGVSEQNFISTLSAIAGLEKINLLTEEKEED